MPSGCGIGSGERPRRCKRGPRADIRALDVAADDPAVRTRPRDRGQVDAAFAGEAPHERADEAALGRGGGGGFGIRRRRRYGGLDGSRCLRRGRHRRFVAGLRTGRLVACQGRDGSLGRFSRAFARRAHDDDRVADRDTGTLGREQLEHGALDLGCVLHDGLVGLDLGQRGAHLHLLADRDEPGRDRGLGHAGEHFRHPDGGGHQAPPIPARRRSMPATTSSVRAIAARSSTFEMLGLASLPVTRCTG